MKYIRFLFQSRGLVNTYTRALKIFQRFGLSPKRSAGYLSKLGNLAEEFNVRPSLPTTAIIIERYPSVFKDLQKMNIELAIHGLYHNEYSRMSYQEQIDNIRKAGSIFDRHGIICKGFRAPYLSWNPDTLNAVRKNGLIWDSNRTILWNVLDEGEYSSAKWKIYNKVLQFLYKPLSAEEYFSLPREENGLIEIPVSIPDDEIIMDRLGIKDTQVMEKIWMRILEESYTRGELFTIMIHPERIPIFLPIIKKIINIAWEKNPPIWIASLSEIAEWWRERLKISWEISEISKSEFRIALKVPADGQIILKNIFSVDCESEPFNGNLKIKKSEFVLKSEVRPVIGVSRSCSANVMKFLQEEGWLYEMSDRREDYKLYLNGYQDFRLHREKELSSLIHSSEASLIRVCRWPKSAQSTLAITGDIDCITLTDFFLRLFNR